MDGWMDDLRRADGALRPEAGALGPVRHEVRRRRRRRSAVSAVVAAASVAVVVGGVAVAVQGGDRPRGPLVGDPSSEAPSADLSPTEPAGTSTAVDPRTFECLTESKVFDPAARAPDSPHLAHGWRRVYAEVAARDEWPGFTVRRLEGSMLGVIALVEGDVQRARRVLMDQYGVTSVVLWDPVAAAAGDHDEWTWMTRDFQQRLSAVADQVHRETRGIPGQAGIAIWLMEGAVLVQWKRPVPAEVRALEDVQFKTGGRVVVEGVRYSQADVRRAQRRLEPWLRRSGHWAHWSAAYACHDGEGLVVGMVPSFLATADVPALQAELAEAVGMPVMLVPEERPVPLTGRVG